MRCNRKVSVFFFSSRRRHTRYWRDWSSDVCSSDLVYNLRLSTHEVAEFVNEVVGRNAPPKGVKIRYATQTGTAPPRFTLFANRPKDVPEGYLDRKSVV